MGKTNLISYVTPASVDHAGQFPFKNPGDQFEIGYKGRLFVARVQDGNPHMMPNGSILREVKFQQVEGPLTRWGAA